MRHYILLTTIALSACWAVAQDLHTEITVDRTVQPELREAVRPKGITPTIVAPEVKVKRLHTAEYTASSELHPDIGILPAASWADSVEHARYRGYAEVGYLPMYNLGINAGYRFIDTPTIGLGLWTQYNGNSYHGEIPDYDEARFTNHIFTLGGNASLRVNPKSLLSASGLIAIKSIRHPYYYAINGKQNFCSYNQGAKEGHAQLRWQSQPGNISYYLGGELEYFSLNLMMPKSFRMTDDGLRQFIGKAHMGVGYTEDNGSIPWIGINMDVEMMRSTNLPDLDKLYRYRVQNLGELKVQPYLRFDNDVLNGLVGLNVTSGIGYDGKLRIAPVAKVDWKPFTPMCMYASVTSGEYINYMSQVFDRNPYVEPFIPYGRTHIPLVAEGGFNIGPFEGMSLGVRGGFAMARDLLSPRITIRRIRQMISDYVVQDVDSWYIGANLGFAYKRYFAIDFDICAGDANKDNASWYTWSDAAKVVADLSVKISPIAPLDVTLGYEMRYDRKALSLIYPSDPNSEVYYTGIPNLGTVNSVNLGSCYRYSDQMTFFLQVDNLLIVRYKLVSGMPAQGINGLIGMSFKF